MLLEFDQNTMANMTAALEHVCKQLPADKDNHETRKRIAAFEIQLVRAVANATGSVGLKSCDV